MGILKAIETQEVVEKSLQEILDRKNGDKATGLKTRWNRLNKAIGGGFQWKYNYLIAGLSGSGKSTLANIIETDLFDLNPDQKFIILNFNFETDSTMNMLKKYSADTGLTIDQITSADENNKLTNANFEVIKEKSKRYIDYPIYYFDVSGTVDDVTETIYHYYKEYKLPMFCILDHTALVTPRNRESELELVSSLSFMTIKVKKALPVSFLMLGQLNSSIEQDERRSNPAFHKPLRSDLFGGKSVWNAMDCIFMPHRPEILDIERYTLKNLETKNRMFFHVSKQRFGRLGMIIMDCEHIGKNIITET